MPITKTITLYKFDELSEEAQESAISSLYHINVDHDWWDPIYEDAKTIGLTIEEFHLEHKKINGTLTEPLIDCCRSIRHNHGKDSDTFKTAHQYLQEYIQAFVKLSREKYYGSEDVFWKPTDWLYEFEYTDEADEITNEFRKALLQDYLIMLDREYVYLTSEEAIKQSIEANEYLFHENGKLA
jgi:hypothetical protein